MPQLAAVGDDDHFVGDVEHGPLGVGKQAVAVEQPPGGDSSNAHEQAADANLPQGLDGERAEHHPGLGVEVAPQHHEFDLRLTGQQIDDGKRVGDNLQRLAHEVPGHLESGGPPIEEDGVASPGEFSRRTPHGEFLRAGLIGALLQWGERLTDVRRPAARAPNMAQAFELLEISANRRFADLSPHRQFGERDKAQRFDDRQNLLPALVEQHRHPVLQSKSAAESPVYQPG